MQETHVPFFSIGLPTYSRLGYLKEAVDSILKQTFQDFEICISQDPMPGGLHPEVLAWSEALSKQHSNVHLRVNKTTRGLAGNWNELAGMAKGQYLMIIGDDDRLLPDYLHEMALALQNGKVDVAFSNQVFIDSEGKELTSLTAELNETYGRNKLSTGLLADPVAVVLGNTIPMSAAVTRTSAVKKLAFKEDLNTPEIELFIRLALQSGTFAYVSRQLAEYRIHPQSATSSGLSIDKLLGYMHDLQVSPTHESYKMAFFRDKIIPAVNMSLRRGDLLLAKKLLYSAYYPSKPIHKFVQTICLVLPKPLTRYIVR